MRKRRLAAFGWMIASALWLVPALRAEEGEMRTSTAQIRREVTATIETQLEAFRSHDPAKAYQMAAAQLRQQMPLASFTKIVQQNYPEIWSNVRANFGIVQDNGSRAVLTVRVFATSGGSASYDYVLFLEPGGWRIAGVLRHEDKPSAAA